jgi:hypothetical protein
MCKEFHLPRSLFRPARVIQFLFFRQKARGPAFTETRHSLTDLSRQPSGFAQTAMEKVTALLCSRFFHL